jgi:hypothetical protein
VSGTRSDCPCFAQQQPQARIAARQRRRDGLATPDPINSSNTHPVVFWRSQELGQRLKVGRREHRDRGAVQIACGGPDTDALFYKIIYFASKNSWNLLCTERTGQFAFDAPRAGMP